MTIRCKNDLLISFKTLLNKCHFLPIYQQLFVLYVSAVRRWQAVSDCRVLVYFVTRSKNLHLQEMTYSKPVAQHLSSKLS